MPFCPKCGYEYLEGVKECPECHEALVPELSAPADDPLVPVYEAPDEVMEVMVRELLEDAGIASSVQPVGHDSAFDGALSFVRGNRVLVLASEAEEARRLISEYEAEVASGEAEREVIAEEGVEESEPDA